MTPSYTYGTYTSTDDESGGSLEITAVLKYKFDGQGLRPHLAGGLCFSDVSASESTKYNYQNGPPNYEMNSSRTSSSALFPIIDAGGGLEFSAGDKMNIFVGGRLDVIIGSAATATYIPLEGGLSFIL